MPKLDFVLFDFDLAGTALLNDDTLALHWGMSCGNDVIEGVATVPAPGVLGLLSLGLLAAAFVRRRATVAAKTVAAK